MLKNEKGFTLIEMLVVLLIITVLILLIVPNLGSKTGDMHDDGCDALIVTVQAQADMYELDTGSLVDLSMKLVIILLFITISYDDLTETEMDVFFAELKSDVDFVQSHNYQTDNFYEIIFDKNNYKLTQNQSNQFILIKEQSYPDDVTVELRNFNRINYKKNGTLKTPGRIIFKEGNKKHHELIFPFGKGGFYIVSP